MAPRSEKYGVRDEDRADLVVSREVDGGRSRDFQRTHRVGHRG